MTLVVRVPLIMMFGDGLCLCPWLVLIRWEVSEANRKHLIPHELRHVEQQRVDGWWRFWWSYLTDQRAKLAYEVQAYKVSIASGLSLWVAADVLANEYRFKFGGKQLTHAQAQMLLEAVVDDGPLLSASRIQELLAAQTATH